MSISMIIGADLVPTQSNYDLFAEGDLKNLIDEGIEKEIFDCDYRVYNLEVPLFDGNAPILKAGPNLIAPTKTVEGLKKFKPSLLTLANNHTRDHDVEGLLSTMETLDKAGIAHFGAGDIETAKKPYIFEKNGKKIGIYACAEHEFTIVTKDEPGANPFDPFESLDHIADLKAQCDYVVCLYHGGKEHYRYPSPNLQKTCRKIIEKGADLVICQHTHCVGCMEEYKGGIVVYGQGNFLFDHSDMEEWQTSILVKVYFDDNMIVSYIPIHKNGKSTRLATTDEAKEIMDGFYSRSEEIKQKGLIEEKYLEISKRNLPFLLYCLAGTEHSGKEYTEHFGDEYTESEISHIINFLECEPHREGVLTAMKDRLKNFKNRGE